jgi:hypothetical protein
MGTCVQIAQLHRLAKSFVSVSVSVDMKYSRGTGVLLPQHMKANLCCMTGSLQWSM